MPQKRFFFTEGQNRWLRANFDKFSYSKLGEFFGTSKDSIRTHLNRNLKLSKSETYSAETRTYHKNYILEHFATQSYTEMAFHLQTTPDRVRMLLRGMGLRKDAESIARIKAATPNAGRFVRRSRQSPENFTPEVSLRVGKDSKGRWRRAFWILWAPGHWKRLTYYNWEKVHGPVPKGWRLDFLNGSDDGGDQSKCSVDNLRLVKDRNWEGVGEKERRPQGRPNVGMSEAKKRRWEQRKRGEELRLRAQQRREQREQQKQQKAQERALRKLQAQERRREYFRRRWAEKAGERLQQKAQKKALEQQERDRLEERREKAKRDRLELSRLKSQMAAQGRKASAVKPKKEEPRLPTRQVDYSQLRLVKVDSKTSIYIPRGQDPAEAIRMYHAKKAAV